VHRRNEKWASKRWNKAHSVTHMKANPLGGAAMAKGIVLEKMYVLFILACVVHRAEGRLRA